MMFGNGNGKGDCKKLLLKFFKEDTDYIINIASANAQASFNHGGHNKEDIMLTIKCFKKYLQIFPNGFRAPQHSIDEQGIDVLRENGFIYDSSIIPWNFYHLFLFWKIKVKFKHHFSKMKIHKILTQHKGEIKYF
jgi:peptidoglycan/xylan/chitin deacetylase (PgdA/CDA1 family)